MIDFSLPEHPDAYKARLTALGVWIDANGLLRRAFGRQTSSLATTSNGKKISLTSQQTAECWHKAYHEVYKFYPPVDDGVALDSLLEWVQQAAIRARKDKHRNVMALSSADERRFDSIGETDDHVGEVLWVYHNLDNKTVQASECPSRGAWAMLAQYRPKKNRDAFYEKLYRPVAQQLSKQKSAADDGVYKPSKAEKLAVEELRTMLKDAVAESAKWE